MISIDKLSRVPIYEQVITQIESLIAGGVCGPGDALPSVRALSVELAVNPNTLQKAFSQLEQRGICQSVPGGGRYVTQNAREMLKSGAWERLAELEGIARELSRIGIEREKVIEAIERVYAGSADKGGKTDD